MKWRLAVNGALAVVTLSASTTAGAASVEPMARVRNGGSALLVLQGIVVERERPAGYSRALFEHWRDVDGDGCDSRDQVLKRDSVSLPQVGPIDCKVVAGDWVSPYDGARWSDPSRIDIDHVVALKEAWDSGAWAWSSDMRRAYANDTSDSRTLLAVTDRVNQSKSDTDPSNWLPPSRSYLCTYLSNWIAVKARWGLSMDPSEWGRVKNLLTGSCPGLTIASWPGLPTSSTTRPSTPQVASTVTTTLISSSSTTPRHPSPTPPSVRRHGRCR
ncbi:MAG: HNH endonuclease family protein, partial [Actinomycetota bacterium]